MKLKQLFICLVITFGITFTSNADAQHKCSSSPKTVHVKSYTTKKGEHVTSHYRGGSAQEIILL